MYVPLNDRDRPPLIVRVPTIDADEEPLWVEHPEHGRAVDIAALDVELPPPGEASVMPMNVIPTVALKQRIGMPIFILGYPIGGWWRENVTQGHVGEAVRYSLIASIRAAPGQSCTPK